MQVDQNARGDGEHQHRNGERDHRHPRPQGELHDEAAGPENEAQLGEPPRLPEDDPQHRERDRVARDHGPALQPLGQRAPDQLDANLAIRKKAFGRGHEGDDDEEEGADLFGERKWAADEITLRRAADQQHDDGRDRETCRDRLRDADSAEEPLGPVGYAAKRFQTASQARLAAARPRGLRLLIPPSGEADAAANVPGTPEAEQGPRCRATPGARR